MKLKQLILVLGLLSLVLNLKIKAEDPIEEEDESSVDKDKLDNLSKKISELEN